MARKKTINIRDLFVEPNFHELEAVATDSKGEHTENGRVSGGQCAIFWAEAYLEAKSNSSKGVG